MSETLRDDEPRELPIDEIKSRLGPELFNTLASRSEDLDGAFEDTQELELELINNAREATGQHLGLAQQVNNMIEQNKEL